MEIFFLLCLFVIAFLYAAVGHGGASGYLALMALFGIAPMYMKSTALTLNLFVAGIAFYQYYKHGYFKWTLFFPFALASVPMAFLGGTISIDAHLYKKILAIFLVFAIVRMLGLLGKPKEVVQLVSPSFGLSLVIGLALGFFSGLIGIGGGIVLSPIILLLGWASMKETAAVSALFIWLNSMAALFGLSLSGTAFYPQMYIWIGVALLGGALGAYNGAVKVNNRYLSYLLALVLFIASIKLWLIQ